MRVETLKDSQITDQWAQGKSVQKANTHQSASLKNKMEIFKTWM